MLSFLQQRWYGAIGRPMNSTQNEEPSTNTPARRNVILFLKMIWHGLLGWIVNARILEGVEEAKEDDHENIGMQTSSEISPMEEFLERTSAQNGSITVKHDVMHLSLTRDIMARGKDNQSGQNEKSMKDNNQKTHTRSVLQMTAYFEELTLNSKRITTTRFGDEQYKNNKKLALISTSTTSSRVSSNDANESDRLLGDSYPDTGQFQVESSFAKEVIIGFVSQSILLLPIVAINYVNNFKQMDISIENRHEKLRFSTEGCFIKGGKLKNLLPTEISYGNNSQIIFEKQVTNIKMAVRGVLTFDIHPSEKGVTYDGQATLVIWWILPALSKNRVAIGVVNSRIIASKSLYKRMKHEQEEWFRNGVVYEIVKKEFPNVLGKYDISIAAQINNQNRASCKVEIG